MKRWIVLGIAIISISLYFWLFEPSNPFRSQTQDVLNSSFTTTLGPQNGIDSQKFESLADSVVVDSMEANDFLGLTAGVYRRGCGTYLVGAGYSSKRDRTLMDQETIVRIASVTKSMTAIAIMQLYERGLLELDAPIQNYLPEFPMPPHGSVTVRQLLNHTSGIPHYTSGLDALSFAHYDSTQAALDEIADRGFTAEPGQAFVYSSFGYEVLGAIVEHVAGVTFEDYLEKHIWRISGMTNTSLETGMLDANQSRLYWKIGKYFVRSPHTDLSLIYPAGGVRSTASDLLKFGRAVLDNKLVSRKTLELMIDPKQALETKPGEGTYTLGWEVYQHPKKGRIIWHTGGQPGANAYLEILLDRGLVVTALSNAFGTREEVRTLSKNIENIALAQCL